MPPREWVSLLGGRDLAPVPPRAPEPVEVGLFAFGRLTERAALPALDAHYVSFTVRGALLVERDLGGRTERAGFRQGMSLILPAGEDNAWRWDRPTDELHLYVAPAFLRELADREGESAPRPIARFAFEDPLLRQLAQALLDDRRGGCAGGALYRDALAETIGLRLLRAHCRAAAPPARSGGLAPGRLRRVRELVEDELHRDLSLDDLAAAAGLSRAHFARAFRHATGDTPYGYLRARRVERARRLLVQSDAPICEIAAAAGFSTQSHFGRVFRAATGVPPSTYRARRR